MKASVDSIEKDSNSVIVVALITGPIVSHSLVRIKDQIDLTFVCY